jgi:hypothetical protein
LIPLIGSNSAHAHVPTQLLIGSSKATVAVASLAADQFTGKVVAHRGSRRSQHSCAAAPPFGCGSMTDGRTLLHHELVRAGLAWWFRRYAPGDRKLERLESEARRARRGLRRDADRVHRGNGEQERNVSGSAAAARSRHVTENPRIFAPHAAWDLNVRYDLAAPDVNRCGGEAEIDCLGFTDLRQSPERIVPVYAPYNAHACSDQLHVPLTTGPMDSSESQGRRAACPPGSCVVHAGP